MLLGFVSSSFPPPCPFAGTIKHSGRAAQRQLSIPSLSYSTCSIRACSFDYGRSHLRCCLQSLFSFLSQDLQKQSCGWSAGGVRFWQQGRTNGAPRCLPLLLPSKGGQAVVGIAVPPRGETSRASLGTHRRVGRWQREGPITLGFPLIPSADVETGGRERRGVPWYRLAAHPFAFDLQQIEERATPNGWLSQTGSVPRTLGAGKAAEGPQHLFVTNLGSTGAVSRTHVPPLAAAHPLHPAKENLPAGHAGMASGAFLTPFLFRNSCCCFC